MQAIFRFVVAIFVVVVCGVLSSSVMADAVDAPLEFTCSEQSADVKLRNTKLDMQKAFQCSGSIVGDMVSYIVPPGRTEIFVGKDVDESFATVICWYAAGAKVDGWYTLSTGEERFQFRGCEITWVKDHPAVSVSFVANE